MCVLEGSRAIPLDIREFSDYSTSLQTRCVRVENHQTYANMNAGAIRHILEQNPNAHILYLYSLHSTRLYRFCSSICVRTRACVCSLVYVCDMETVRSDLSNKLIKHKANTLSTFRFRHRPRATARIRSASDKEKKPVDKNSTVANQLFPYSVFSIDWNFCVIQSRCDLVSSDISFGI